MQSTENAAVQVRLSGAELVALENLSLIHI